MTRPLRPDAEDGPGAPGPAAPHGVSRREVLVLTAAGIAIRPPERVVISPSGWILLESDLR